MNILRTTFYHIDRNTYKVDMCKYDCFITFKYGDNMVDHGLCFNQR